MSVKRALLLSTGDRYIVIGFNFATIAAVSRILTPEEIGISVICLAILGIALSAREFASSSFMIQRPVLSREDIRGTFSMMLALTAAIAAFLVTAAPALASSFHEEKLVPYLRLVSVCLFIELVPIQIITLMRREMAFGKVAVINFAGAATGGLSTIALALAGFSYMSFAWAWLASSAVTALLALSLRPDFWMFRPTYKQWRRIAAFGGYNGAMVFLYRAYEALPLLLLGRVLSPHAAALFSRGLTVCQTPDKLILGGAMSVVLPAFAASARQGGDLKRSYLHALEIITGLHWPALLALAALSYPTVDILLGHQWRQVAPLVQVMALASLFTFSFELNNPVMTAMGSIRDMFVRSLIVIPVSAVIMTAAVLLAGLMGAALSLMVIVPFQAFVSLGFVRRRLSVGWDEIAVAVRKSSIVAALTTLGSLATVIAGGFRFDLSPGQAIFAGGLAAAGWLAGVFMTRHPLFDEIVNAGRTFRDAVAAA
ncbi:oligosaccharide flippase family protein [Mesorhizobium sp. M1050]|uniref:oligosaccharide flippase family protein n=1 Tax=Mesorhizobium sp. M1050 TaxID=2957051 RepID=UPI003335B49E